MERVEVGRRLEAIARMSGEAAQVSAIHQQADIFLYAPAGIETVLCFSVKDKVGQRSDIACAVLSTALDGARMAAENNSPHGSRFLELVEAAVRQLEAAKGLDATSRIRLAQIYARAQLEPPPEAKLTPEVLASMTRKVAEQMPDVSGMLSAVVREAGQVPLQAHATLSEALAAMPDEARAAFVQTISSHDGPIAQHLALYWLLDRVPGVRLAAATALLGRANVEQLDPEIAASLPSIRKWLPAEPARAIVDAAIRACLRRGGSAAQGSSWKVQRVVASLPDGAGAQSIAALVQRGRRRGVAFLLLKQGHGVKDAFIYGCSSVRGQERLVDEIGDQIALLEIQPDYVPSALSRALGDGAMYASLPAPGLVDMLAIWDGEALSPRASDPRAILAAIGADEALAAKTDAERGVLLELSGTAVYDIPHFESWFEDSANLAASLALARGKQARQAAVWRHLETRRDWWARQLAVCAATLKASSSPDQVMWLSLAVSAQALLDQSPLRNIGIMEPIVEFSLQAADGRPGREEPDEPELHVTAMRPEKRGELARLLATSGISEAYVQGYLTGLAVCPQRVSADSWLGALLGGIEFRVEGAVQRVVDLVFMRANKLNQDVGDQATIREGIAALDEGALRDWARGFATLVRATKRAWSAGALAPADRHMLRNLDIAGKGGEQDGLREVLPAWITARHARRR